MCSRCSTASPIRSTPSWRSLHYRAPELVAAGAGRSGRRTARRARHRRRRLRHRPVRPAGAALGAAPGGLRSLGGHAAPRRAATGVRRAAQGRARALPAHAARAFRRRGVRRHLVLLRRPGSGRRGGRAACAAARAAGWCSPSRPCQEDDAQGHRLQANGRYAHTGAYLRAAILHGGLELLALQAGTLRLEAGRPVPGWMVSARRP